MTLRVAGGRNWLKAPRGWSGFRTIWRLLPTMLLMVLLAERLSDAAGPDWTRDESGTVRIHPVAIPDHLKNATWPEQWEREFQQRANDVIARTARPGRYGNTFFENEKRSYGWAMLSILGGYEEEGLAFLQSEDADADRWHRHTRGIDFFAAFTLKHQIRKYFFFGHKLDPAYKKKMFEGARTFTERDPLRREHHAYTGNGVWGPDGKNSWVDVRSTDNLKLMRDTSVYLLAEETGNETTRQHYRRLLIDFIATTYYTGMGEWDSENYLGHSAVPLLNLYDFSRDDEVRLLAKAALDRIAVNLAIKYWRGNFNGPTRRDYNHPVAFGGSAASLAWMWFGQSPLTPTEFESDEIEIITSAYRPPVAVVELARRNFERPRTITSGKPDGSHWEHPDEQQPRFYETQHFGKTFQFGTLARGTQNPDINGFKLLTYSSSRGADTVMAAPCGDPTKLGSPVYQPDLLAHHSAVAQYDNQAIYLTEQSDQPYLFLVPSDARIERHSDVLFVFCERTTIAIWPLNLSLPQRDESLTRTVQHVTKGEKTQPRWPDSQILRGVRAGQGVYGFAIEVNEGDPARFVRAARELRPTTDELESRGATVFTGTGGKRIRLQWGNTLPAIRIWLDGRERDWSSAEAKASYRTIGGELVSQSWQGDGTLSVQAGGSSFTCQVTREGQVTFDEKVR